MRIVVLHAYPPEPDGLSIQGNLLYRGLKEIGVDVMPCHYQPSFEKQWVYSAFSRTFLSGSVAGPTLQTSYSVRRTRESFQCRGL